MLKLAALNPKNNNTNNNTTSNIIHGGLALGGAGLGLYSYTQAKPLLEKKKRIDELEKKWLEVGKRNEKRMSELDRIHRNLSPKLEELRQKELDADFKVMGTRTKLNSAKAKGLGEDKIRELENQLMMHQSAHEKAKRKLEEFEKEVNKIENEYNKLTKETGNARKMYIESLKEPFNKEELTRHKALGALGAGLALYGTYKLIKNNT